jgi:CRISPR/Cas system-associated endonuclease Cas1
MSPPPSLLWIDTPGTALQVRMKSLAVRFGDGRERHFPRGKHSLRSIILHAPGASVTIEAARWAVDEGVTVLIMHRAGEALAFLINHPLADCSGPALELRRAQFSADPVKVARAVVRAKIEASRTEGVLLDEDAGFGISKLLKAETVNEILLIEAAMSGIYWRHWYGFELSFSGKAPPEWKRYGTRTRKVSDGLTSERCRPWERHSQLRLCRCAGKFDAHLDRFGT